MPSELQTSSHAHERAAPTRRADIPRWKITDRQLECLAWVAAGKSATDIGSILGVSRRTVESHLKRVCEHLEVKTRLQAALKAQAHGLIPSPAP